MATLLIIPAATVAVVDAIAGAGELAIGAAASAAAAAEVSAATIAVTAGIGFIAIGSPVVEIPGESYSTTGLDLI